MMELPDYNFYEFKEPLDAHFALEEWEDSYKQNSSPAMGAFEFRNIYRKKNWKTVFHGAQGCYMLLLIWPISKGWKGPSWCPRVPPAALGDVLTKPLRSVPNPYQGATTRPRCRGGTNKVVEF